MRTEINPQTGEVSIIMDNAEARRFTDQIGGWDEDAAPGSSVLWMLMFDTINTGLGFDTKA